MQTVSASWKDIHKKSLLNESFVEVSLDIADPDAILDAKSTDNGAIYISDSESLTDGGETASAPYCTLEQNLWCLDGSHKAIPETSIDKTSFVSDVLSDDSCVFSGKIPTITINFDEKHPILIPGITIRWSSAYNEFAESFDVVAYDGDTVVASKSVMGNKTVKSLIFVDIANYNKIVILIRKWCLPHHRARVEDVLIGINKVYGKSELFDYSHSQFVDPLSISLPKFEINFSIDNIDGEYNPYNPYGLAKYLVERQEVKTRYGLKLDDGSIEWIPGGTFYLSEWYAKQNGLTADFTARDMLEFMSAVYTESHDFTSRSLYTLATNVLEAADMPKSSEGKDMWSIDSSLENIYTTAPLPVDTIANCLQLIANAARCVLYQDRNGILHIEPLKGSDTDTSEDTDYQINAVNSYSKPEITLSKPLKQVKVRVHEYSSDGESTTEISYPTEVSNDIKGEIVTIDNPLVTEVTNPNVLGEWLYTHLSHRMTLDSSWRADVRLDALDIIKNENEYGTNRVRMTEVEFKYNGAFRGTSKGKVIGNG
jgi:hypothetical protein